MALPTKADLIGQVLLAIGGGVVTPDLQVRWGDAETYLCMAVNYVQTGNYWLESKAEGEKTINPLMLTAFNNIPISYSTDNLRYYSDLPANIITLPKGRALEVMTMCGKKCFPLGQGDESLASYYTKYQSYISYQLEGTKRIWFYNLPKLVDAIRAKFIVSVWDLDDDAEIILPSDGYVKVVDMMINFFLAEKNQPKDTIEDGKQN